MLSLDYKSHPWRRVVLLAFVWAVLSYLLFHPVYEYLQSRDNQPDPPVAEQVQPATGQPGGN